ncbi:uncharacterized protein LOC122252634 isoform X4 [Penaeus japonicus]|uniref:uncharacterized protein LOC122252634 isoform X4 n=1 Tax=Penaeus japonicus TaxID=27405 RepID=UPI001C716862|nr:uncharacterized protein LOC122252634 isoform X4 [Penaeus japonicus]
MPVYQPVRGDRPLQLLRFEQGLCLQRWISHGRLPQCWPRLRRRWFVSVDCGSSDDGSSGRSSSHVRHYLRGTASLLQSPFPREPLHLQHPQPPPDERLAVQRQKARKRDVRRLRHWLGGGRGQDAQPLQEGGRDHRRHRDRGLRSPSRIRRRRRRRRQTSPSESTWARREAPGHTEEEEDTTAPAAGDEDERPPPVGVTKGAARAKPTGPSGTSRPVTAPSAPVPRRAKTRTKDSKSFKGAGTSGSLWVPGRCFTEVGFIIQHWIKLNCRRSCVLGTTSIFGTF